MKLTLLFDHRFYADSAGTVYSRNNYDYNLFAQRYLTVFEQVDILARLARDTSGAWRGPATEGPGVHVVSLGNWTGPLALASKLPAVQRRISAAVNKRSAVIMIAPGMVGTLGYPLLRMRRYPYGIEVVGDPFDAFAPGVSRHPMRSAIRSFTSRVLRLQCANAVSATYVTERYLQQRYPPNPRAFSTNSSDVAMVFVDALPAVDPDATAFTIVHVGTMSQSYKAQDIIIQALARCVKQGIDVRLALVGDGQQRAELAMLAKACGVVDRVTFCGQLPPGVAVRQELDRADLFVMPSRTEGLPRAMLEAMARGLPCIGTRVGGIPELLDEEQLVPVDDIEALAQKIQALLNDPPRRMALAARNLAVAMQYRPKIMQARREAFYTDLKDKTVIWQQRQVTSG